MELVALGLEATLSHCATTTTGSVMEVTNLQAFTFGNAAELNVAVTMLSWTRPKNFLS